MVLIPAWGEILFATRTWAQALALALSVAFAFPAAAAITTTGNVEPDPSTTTSSTILKVGNTADGTMAINAGSTVTSGVSQLGYNSGVTGTVTITDNNSKWTVSGLTVGESGTGNLTISNGASVLNNSASGASVGSGNTGSGTLIVTGSGTQFTVSDFFTIGVRGSGTLNVSSGGTIVNGNSQVGSQGGSGNVMIDGTSSSWTTSGLFIGQSNGHGDITIQNGALLSSDRAYTHSNLK